MKVIKINDGLGDHVALAGACVYLARQYDGLVVACKPWYFESIYAMFEGTPEVIVAPRMCTNLHLFQLHSNGKYTPEMADRVIPYLRAEQAKAYHPDSWVYSMLIDATTGRMPSGIDCDHYSHVYRDLLKVDYAERWNSSPFIGNTNVTTKQYAPPKEPYVFLHDDPSRNFFIDRRYIAPHYRIITPVTDVQSNFMRYSQIIENAAEVHCMDSCFFHLTEQLNPKGRLYLHRYARPYTPGWMDYATKHDWENIYTLTHEGMTVAR